MPIVIDNPAAEEKIHAFATARGLKLDAAIIAAILDAEASQAQEPMLDDEELERALRGKAQIEAGETVSLEESHDRGREELLRRFAEKEKAAQERAA